MKSYGFLFWAYLLIWLGLASYVAFLIGKLGHVQRTLAAVERRLSATEPSRTDQRSSDS